MTFNQSELIQTLRQAQRLPKETPNSITVPEVRRSVGCGDQKARAIVRAAMDAGVIRPERVWRVNVMGDSQRVAGYVLVERPKPS